jgi:hypothetical protein
VGRFDEAIRSDEQVVALAGGKALLITTQT